MKNSTRKQIKQQLPVRYKVLTRGKRKIVMFEDGTIRDYTLQYEAEMRRKYGYRGKPPETEETEDE